VDPLAPWGIVPTVSPDPAPTADGATEERGLLGLAVLSFFAGAAAGLVGALFRLSLERAESLRNALITWSDNGTLSGVTLVVGVCAGATAGAAWLVRRYAPHAAGSGIPHVEAVLSRELPQAPYRLIPIKFLGGVLAMGAGLALGREGPSVQMGASVANLLGTVFRRSEDDCRALLAAGAGAGLATAFNAPIAGAVFVLEELVRRFDTRITITTLGASTGAIAVARVLLGDAPDFRVEPLLYPGFATVPIHLALGVLAGSLAIAYNRTILGLFAAAGRLRRWPVELRAAVVGAVVGLLAWFVPGVVGGGDVITQRTLTGPAMPIGVLSIVFLIRFGLGGVSYAARTPGGLFAPLLVLGAQLGVLFSAACGSWFPGVTPDPVALAVVGMAAFFTGVVRAPITGVILITEMTASFTLLLPLLGASFAAMLLPTLIGEAPIYESLRESAARPRGV
jgi:CIC family chloride channel protein